MLRTTLLNPPYLVPGPLKPPKTSVRGPLKSPVFSTEQQISENLTFMAENLHMTWFQIKGGSLVQGVTKLITNFSA